MLPDNLTHLLIGLPAAVAAGLAFLPYSWAHVASGAIVAAIAAYHVTGAIPDSPKIFPGKRVDSPPPGEDTKK